MLDKGWVPLPVLDEVRERPQLVLWSTILVGRGGPRIFNQNLKISLKNYIFLKKIKPCQADAPVNNVEREK